MRIVNIILAFITILLKVNVEASFASACFKSFNTSNPKHGWALNFVKLLDSKFNSEADEIITMVSSKIITFKCMIQDFSQTGVTFKTKEAKNIMIFETFSSFKRFKVQFDPGDFHHQPFILVALIHHQNGNISEIFDFFWKFSISNVNVMRRNDKGDIDLLTFYPKNNKSCDDVTPVKINAFNETADKWINTFSFPEKFKNFHRCPIRVAVNEIYGFEFDVFKEIGRQLNYSIKIMNISNAVGKIYPNGSAIGGSKEILDGNLDFIIKLVALDESRTKYFSFVNSFFEDWFIIVVPPPPELTPLVKLLYPFQAQTWLALMIFLVTSLSSIFALKHSKFNYNFVIGLNVQHPYLNIIVAFIGQSQRALPKGFFARYVMSCFLLFSLVVRSMYVGKLYSTMKSTIHMKGFTMIEEFYDEGYKFYVHDGIAHKFLHLKYFDK